jgi:chromosome segregation ATPase
VKKINVEFQEFFSLMFGGGHGSLSIVVETKRRRTMLRQIDEDG